MAFQTALSIGEVLDGIHSRKYLLPAIQREFVWKPRQIEELFDSLMRGYPIGSFLFWEVAAENVDKYAFFDFIVDYDARTPHNDPASVPSGRGVTAILDGQQRLTAFNIALRGSHTEKLPRLHGTNPKAFPEKRLYLDLAEVNTDAAPDEPMFSFRFLSDAEFAELSEKGEIWFRVGDAKVFDPESTAVYDHLHGRGLADHKVAHSTLYKLTQLVHKAEVVSYYLEKSDDLDKVLNIFIRVNSGGTQLSYSDLLLSVATAKWSQRDARKEINDLVDEINDVGQKFTFDKDRVLKACLVLGDFGDIKFKAANFRLDNMLQIEKQWDTISDALLVAAQLLASFGLSSETLTAENVLLPIAYYIQHRKLSDSFVLSSHYADDRESIRLWVIRSLLRTGFWTGAVDTILTTTRDMIRAHGADGFPVQQIEEELRVKAGKSLVFENAEVEDLLDTAYKSRTAVLLLTLLYPWVEMNQSYHKDHVFPRSLFHKPTLMKAGIEEADIESYKKRVDLLPNLQLLPGLLNQEKSSMYPADWARDHLSDHKRQQYLEQYDLGDLPTDLIGFPGFFVTRRETFRQRLVKLLQPAGEKSG